MAETRTVHVFIASPGDLAVERRAFKDVIDELNSGFGDGAGVKFVPLGWEDTLATTGRRPQNLINREIDRCDVFILALHRRWGQEAPDARPYTSYTEEEFHRALDRWNRTEMPEIFVFFKQVGAASMGDPGEQLKKVLDFRKSLEESRNVLYRFFADEGEFSSEISKHLRAYAKGDLPKAAAQHDKVILPLEYVEAVKKAREVAEQQRKLAAAALKRLKARKKRKGQVANQQSRGEAEEQLSAARAEELALLLAEQAAKAAREGRVEEARQLFAKAHIGTTQLRILYLAAEFYLRTGDLTLAEQVLERWLAISGRDAESIDTAAAVGNLGLVYRTRGDLGQAEEMHKKALVINEKLGRLEGMAADYTNLGLVYKIRGDLGRAEDMNKKALLINKKLGRLEGMAKCYGNLGVVYQSRGDLDRAEAMHKKSLAIEERIGRLEGMANAYGNLGLIYEDRDDLQMAEEMHKKSLAIEEKIGRQEGMAQDYGNLGLIYRKRGDLDRAEEMHKRSLAINEKLGRTEGVALQYGGLGQIAKDRGDVQTAREFWSKAHQLCIEIGMTNKVKAIEDLLNSLTKEK